MADDHGPLTRRERRVESILDEVREIDENAESIALLDQFSSDLREDGGRVERRIIGSPLFSVRPFDENIRTSFHAR